MYKYIGSAVVSISFFLFFLSFDRPPLFFKLFLTAFFAITKDVGMAANHLFINASDGVVESKGVILGIDFGHEDQQKEHVAKFFTEIFRIIVVDGSDNLGEFFNKIFFQAES